MSDRRGNHRWCAVLAAVLAVAACSAPHREQPAASVQSPPSAGAPPASSEPSTVAAQPKTVDAAIAAAQEKADRHASGDFAGEWMLFTKDLRDHMPQDAFVEYSEVCSPTGLKIKVTGGRLDGPDNAVLRQEALGVTLGVNMTYENGGWYKVPDDDFTVYYGKTGAEIIAAEKAEGNCHKQ